MSSAVRATCADLMGPRASLVISIDDILWWRSHENETSRACPLVYTGWHRCAILIMSFVYFLSSALQYTRWHTSSWMGFMGVSLCTIERYDQKVVILYRTMPGLYPGLVRMTRPPLAAGTGLVKLKTEPLLLNSFWGLSDPGGPATL